MPQTWGVPVEEIQRGIKFGVRKINIDTDCRIAMTAAFRRVADRTSAASSTRAPSSSRRMAELGSSVRQRFEEFGTAGHASKIKAAAAV